MSELYNDLYQRMNGFKPIKRDYKKKGETDWYYLDSRDAETVSDMQQIDVANENTANPKIKEILAYDMKENPENYYIWRTCKDDKVRGAHAEREGKIYNKYIPPEGGNPGEDYNCRCWAEPYQSQRTRQPDDVAKVDLSGLPQYAKGGREDCDSYARRKVKFRSREEEKLLQRIGKQIISREDTIEYAYLDSSGYKTTGNGALIDDWNSFRKVHWLRHERPATEDEKWAEFKRMEKVREDIIATEIAEAKANNRPYRNPFQKFTAKNYKENSVLEITKDEADYLMYSHLQKDYDNLKHYLPEFDNAPQAAQDVAFDIQYNPGITDTTWTYFKKYFNEKNVDELAKQVHRIGVSEKRNNEMRNKILSINRW